MGVMLQAFYWDCPQTENREHQWWSFIKSKLPAIAQAGFTALWLPPANKAASWKSMGYDPYDYYDLGEFDQKGGAPTWFGSKADLLDLIESAHALGLQVYADLVFNHNSGADVQESNPTDEHSRWTKFTPKSGCITVEAAARDDEVVFSVADTGPGIARESLQHIFEPFWQAATRAARLGAGLGLPITRGIVDAHGGRIWVESELERGSTFFFAIPAAPAEKDASRAVKPSGRSAQRRDSRRPRRQRS